MNPFDIAIVGAGPAGSAAAISLARRGYAVALIDKEQFPREKLCGDFINPSNQPMLEQLGVTSELFMQDHEIVTAFRITADSGAAAEAALPSLDGAPVFGLGLRRYFFDQILLNKAEREGVTAFPGCRIKALHRQPYGWRIGYGRGESIEELNARVLIGADGRILGGAPSRHGRRRGARRWPHRLSAAAQVFAEFTGQGRNPSFPRRLRRGLGAWRRHDQSLLGGRSTPFRRARRRSCWH